eukprot:Gb_03693 [translate_table: standard]
MIAYEWRLMFKLKNFIAANFFMDVQILEHNAVSICSLKLRKYIQMQFFTGQYSRKMGIGVNTFVVGKLNENLEADMDFWGAKKDVDILCNEGRLKEALEVLYLMKQRGISVDSNAYSRLLQGCVNTKALVEGKRVHAQMIKTGFELDIFARNNLINMYARCGTVVHARQVFDEMIDRSAVSWNAMIAGYVHHGQGGQALEIFCQMQGVYAPPNEFTFASVLRVCVNLPAIEQGKQLHAHIMKSGFESDVIVGSILVDMYAKWMSVHEARKMFDRVLQRDVVSWTTMIAGYAQAGQAKEALKLYLQMQLEGTKPNEFTFTSVLGACASGLALEEGKQFHAHLIKSGFESSVFAENALVDTYTKCKSVEDARKVFDKMHKRDPISWTTMVVGYAQNSLVNESLQLFCHMQWEGMKPDQFTFASLISACAGITAIEQGKQFHAIVIKTGFEWDVFVENALVDMYSKCGSIETARTVFDKIFKRDVISWTAMIVGYAQHGLAKKAIQLFEQMQQEGMKPNHITFVGVLFACSHAGLIDKGRYYFESMSRDHGITPRLEHYVCMVDLLGRVGHLDEAEKFIKEMPLEPGVLVWQTLLGACKIHGNIELGKWAAARVMDLEPQDSAAYVLMSNMYATAGRWDDAAKVRNMMKDRGVKKEPARSWIEVKNKIHTFVVGDEVHPQRGEIYSTLEKLIAQAKEAGYVPNLNFVLQDLEQDQKEHSLYHHSEKLAIAFGLISMPPKTPIRIIKNLRVCGDCHEAAKFISKVVEREIVVRDVNRFHHFKDGLCSCHDYW